MRYNGDIAQGLWAWKGITPRKGRIGGWKVTHPDLTTRDGFQWPAKGKVTATGPFTTGAPCPSAPGDGLCVAVTFAGASSGGIPANGTGLLVEYAGVLGSDLSKVRVPECWVRALIDVPRAIREGALSGATLYGATLSGADLSGATLSGANLSRATLYGATLYGANLSRANLSGATLSGADLYGANLSRANLSRANLSGATLSGANLSGADLSGANLSRANLYGANLSRATLSRANLSGANLSRATLYGANLSEATLSGATASQSTRWPDGFDTKAAGVTVR